MIKRTFLFVAFVAIQMLSAAQADTAMFPLPKDYPKYPAGKEALNAFIQQNIVYPEYEKSMGIEGTVVVYCDVELDGTLSNFRIGSTVEGSVGFDAEAIRVCQKLGKFTPCMRNGKPLCFIIDIDVKFDLNNGDEMEMAIAKLSNQELKEIEKDAKWFCDFLSKTTEARRFGDEDKLAKLTSKYQKELDVLEDKYPGKSPKSVQFERLCKPCMERMFKSMGIVDTDGDGHYTQEEAELTAKELRQIEKDAREMCEIINDIIELQIAGDTIKTEAYRLSFEPKMDEFQKKYPKGSALEKKLEELVKPCMEEAMKLSDLTLSQIRAYKKLSKRERKRVEKDAKFFCDLINEWVSAKLAGDINKIEELQKTLEPKMAEMLKKYPKGSNLEKHLETLIMPCLKDAMSIESED